jgi:hypothetical protein
MNNPKMTGSKIGEDDIVTHPEAMQFEGYSTNVSLLWGI